MDESAISHNNASNEDYLRVNTINYLQLRTQELSPEDFTKHIKSGRQEEEIIIYFDHQNNVVNFGSKFIYFISISVLIKSTTK